MVPYGRLWLPLVCKGFLWFVKATLVSFANEKALVCEVDGDECHMFDLTSEKLIFISALVKSLPYQCNEQLYVLEVSIIRANKKR